jgi:hypothetical protein
MPRRPDSLNENTYHFKVVYFDELHDEERIKLFRTQNEISEVFKISRSTIYNYYMNLSANRTKQNILKIEKGISKKIPDRIQKKRRI